MAQVDPWEKAADCERAIRITLDPLYRETLTNIREFWIALAHKSRFLSDDALYRVPLIRTGAPIGAIRGT